jgi:D-alanine-D-alanine ligase
VSHLNRERYEVTPVRIDTDGVWTVGKDVPAPAGVDTATLLHMTDDRPGPRPTVLESMWSALSQLHDTVDVAFPALHGRYGEDGILQSTLDMFGIPYVGNGVLSSAAGMDKEVTKKLLSAAGLTVADGVVLRGPDEEISPADRERLGLPVFVKPAREGSSIGVSKVDDWSQLDEAVATARKTDSKVLIEAAVPGREVDVGVLQYPDGRVAAGPRWRSGFRRSTPSSTTTPSTTTSRPSSTYRRTCPPRSPPSYRSRRSRCSTSWVVQGCSASTSSCVRRAESSTPCRW